ncbi:ABC transporter permease [Plantactinospora sp. KBS50]|uniref:ABC transporter permease n=1 Tax=Plantactinospora sp. KBS50 TaxID=2024580 RepID=UPI000BAAD626|nr:ABC transporter permease [Plantactinospora sp. KBS50]ASW55739.1 peptide ABC transporter permease [Plantactinospora sp. KBS50]
MLKFLVRKVPSVLLVLVASSMIAFLLPRLAPGDPAVVLAGPDPTPEVIASIRAELGLNQPLWQQYLNWVGGLLHGDLGQSYILHRPVSELIANRIGSTLQLSALATLIMIAIGLLLGILGGARRSPAARLVIDGFNTVFLAAPPFLTGMLLILLLGVVLPVLPVSGEMSVFDNPSFGLQYLLLPAIALALPQAAVIARLLQTSMLATRSEDFVDLAKAKGVPGRRITRRHVLRNSLGSVVVVIGLRIGELLAGAIVVEAIFARNGLGALAVSSVDSRDYLVVQVLILAAVFIAVMLQLLSEIILAALDPRIRLEA